MTGSEAEQLVGEMGELWPDWEPNEAQTKGWRAMLLAFDYESARRAVRRHWEDSNWKRPAQAKVKATLRAEAARQAHQQGEKEEPLVRTGVFVQCHEAPPERPGRLGHYIELIYPRKRLPSDIHYILQDAQQMCDQLVPLYGGKWRIVQEADALTMMKDRQAMQIAAEDWKKEQETT